MTEAQQEALRDLRRLSKAHDGFSIVGDPYGPDAQGRVHVEIECDTTAFERREGGFDMADGERLLVSITPNYPQDLPIVNASHHRWAEREHVLWGTTLCLYRAPDVEWDPSAGVLGFVARLEDWLRDAAAGTLDRVGVPMHPPVAYPTRSDAATVVVRVDAPRPRTPWHGFAQLREVRPNRFDVVAWTGKKADPLQAPVALAILTPATLAAAYPATLQGLRATLERLGAPLDLALLRRAVLANPAGTPLIVMLGTPQRGIVGDEMAQHLVAWRVRVEQADRMREFFRPARGADGLRHRDVQAAAAAELDKWEASAEVDWCVVQEARTEVTVRRDAATPMAAFRGKVVEIWGCGALGGWAAELIARAGPRRLILRDNRFVTVGSLVRQPYTDADVGMPKASALAARLAAIEPGLDVDPRSTELIQWIAGRPTPSNADVLINATASRRVDSALERAVPFRHRVPIATIGINGTASLGRLVWCPPGYTGGPVDAKRKLRLAVKADEEARPLLDAFWRQPDAPFVPEPGCSEPTFVASASDVTALSAQLVNRLAALLDAGTGTVAVAAFVPRDFEFSGACRESWLMPSDRVLVAEPYRVHLSADAAAAIRGEIAASAAERGSGVETGGLLFGERDAAARRLWVTVATPPPRDSTHAPSGFTCGVVGTRWRASMLRRRHGSAVTFVGTWHTHPGGAAAPSATDIETMLRLAQATDTRLSAGLLLVVGGDGDRPEFGAAILHDTPLPE